MKFLVTGVGGQLGHDVMNELIKRGHEGIGSDIAPEYSGVKDNSAVTAAPYISLDITDKPYCFDYFKNDIQHNTYRECFCQCMKIKS